MTLQGLDNQDVNSTANPAESFNRNLDFFTITVSGGTWRSDGVGGVDGENKSAPNDAEQYLFDLIIEGISQKTQPVVLTGGGTGSTVLNFISEHTALWTEAGATDPKAETLKTVLDDMIAAASDDDDSQLFAGVSVAIAYSATL